MNDYCHIVPWYNTEEWTKVYEELSKPDGNKEYALSTLLVWKARCPSLPSGIESTLSLLQVRVEDKKQDSEGAEDQLLRLAYSSAVMRFVNHMLDTETIKGTSLYRAAKNLGVPDWIVDLRHDTAHSHNLPHIALLREACAISLQWLQQNYWDKYKPNIHDYLTGQWGVFNVDENNVTALINLCTSLSICAHHNCNIKNLSELPNIETSESIVNDVKYLFGDQVDLSNLKTVSVMSLINLINKQNIQLVPNVSKYVNETILGEDSLFLSKDLLYYFSANDFKHKNRLNSSYVQCFEVLLTFLHTNDLLLDFVLALIKITQNVESPYFKARLAALWVNEILMALKRSQDFSQKFKQMTVDNKSKKKKDLKQLYNHWFPNTKGKNLILDLEKPVPKQLSNINYIRPIIAAYNPYLIYFIKNLLNLLDPSIPSSVADRIHMLAELISSPEKFSPSASTIYTVDDLRSATELNDEQKDSVASSFQVIEAVELQKVDVQDQQSLGRDSFGIWKLAPRNHKWSSCPIGQLPWQGNIAPDVNHD